MSYIKIFRALPLSVEPIFRPDDYVTPSEKFALEHAETSAIYNGEDYQIIRTVVDDSYLKKASNPGEYLMTKEVKGKKIWEIVFDEESQTADRKRIYSFGESLDNIFLNKGDKI